MKITICGSMKFNDKFLVLKENLEKLEHEIFMPIAIQNLDYWSDDRTQHIQAKKEMGLLQKHMDKIYSSNAILVANYTKNDVENYIGANTFLEMGYAKYIGKKIFLLNAMPDQKYIQDEIISFEPIILNGDLSKIV